jgi:putative hemolysin
LKTVSTNKFIDIEELIKSKNPNVLKWIPKFLLSYLKKIIHQNEVNDFMLRNSELKGSDFCNQVIKEFNIKIITKGTEYIPKEGGYIFCSNHPLGGMDAMIIVSVFSKIRRDIKFIVNDLLLNLTNLQGLFVGVNKVGKNAVSSLQNVDELFASNQAIFVFPAGLVSRKKNGVVKDLEWKKTFITRAKKHQKNIVPVFVDGELTNFFYRLANFRTTLGIKSNIEMLYLADELYRQKNKTVTIVFGKSINYSVFGKEKTDFEWAQWMKNNVYGLKDLYT